MSNTNIIDVLIIGSGPAGWTAAIYSSRSMVNTMVLTGRSKGGQLMITNEVENYPGFESITGPELMEKMEKHAIKYGTKVKEETVESISKKDNVFYVKLVSGETLLAHTAIIATGAQAKWIGLESEEKYKGFGVSGCGICDGFFFKDEEVAIIGGGNTAMEDAIYLCKYAKKVYLIHRRDTFRAEKILQNRVMNNEKIEIVYNSAIKEILGTEKPNLSVNGITITDVKTKKEREIKVTGVFIAIGHKPTTDFVSDIVKLDSHGYILLEKNNTESNIPGLFAAGDVTDSKYRQAVSSAGMGCMSALDANEYLLKNNITK